MLRRLSYLLIVIAALTGCNGERMPIDSAIRFGVHSEAQVSTSKVSTVPDDIDYLFTDGNQVGVFGSWTSSEGVTTDVFSRLPLTCEKQADDSFEWVYSPLKFWRKGGVYDFSAVFPYSVNCQYGSSGNRLVITYSMHADDYDLMVAATERDLTSSDDTSPVDLTFRHATAAVRFLFSKGSESNEYYIDSFQLQYLHTVGILVYNSGEMTVSNWNPAEFRSPSVLEWEAGSLDDRIYVPQNYSDFTGEKWHFVIPQNLNADDGYHPAVQFSVNVNDGTTPVYTTLPLPETYANNSDVLWEPGKMYTYYIQIQPSNASITVKVTPWDSYYVAVDDINFD